jgi:hypothetical protein
MSKNFYEYYRILGIVNVDRKKWDEYGSDIYMNVIADSINSVLEESGFERVSLPKKLYYKEKDLKLKMLALFNEMERFTNTWDISLVLVWQKTSINVEIRQKVEKLNVDPNDSNRIFRMLKSLMEGKNNE